MEDEQYLGYIEYEGTLVAQGLMDARRQANALLAFDSALRYFISKQMPEFGSLDFEIPVRVRKGTWEALLPETVAGWAQAGLGIVITAYLAKAAQKMAEKDFADVGLSDVFRKAMASIKWFARISKHMGSTTVREFKNVSFSDDRSTIGIVNAHGAVLNVPKDVLDIYVTTSPTLLDGLATNVEAGRILNIATVSDKHIDKESIGPDDRHIFTSTADDEGEDLLFPELNHGDAVILEGELTRGNSTSNSMGFRYKDHILNVYPETGSIVQYKPLLFLECRLNGTVDRTDENGHVPSRRPKLRVSKLERLQVSGSQRGLFTR